MFTKFFQRYVEQRQLAIHQELCKVNRDGGEGKVIGFAGKHFMFSSLIKRIRSAACREIATFLVNLTYYNPGEAPVIAKDLAKNIRDPERHRTIVNYIKENTRHPVSAALLLAEIRILP